MFIHPLKKIILNFAGKNSLQTVFVVPFALQIVVAVGLVGYLSFRNGEQAVNDLANQLMGEVSERVKQNLQTYLITPHQINQSKQDAVKLGYLKMENLQPWEKFLWRQVQLYPYIFFSSVGNKFGEYRTGERLSNGSLTINKSGKSTNFEFRAYNTNKNGDRTTVKLTVPDFDIRKHTSYTSAAVAKKPTWSDVYVSFLDPTLIISALQPVYNQQQQLDGVLISALRLDHIGKFLNSLKIGKTGQAFIMERNGILLATSTSEKPFRIEGNQKNLFLAKESSDPITRATGNFLARYFQDYYIIQTPQKLKFEINGKKQYLQVVPFQDGRGLDWLIVTVVPEADFMEQIYVNNRTTVMLCIAAILISICLGVQTSRWVTKPILKLNKSAKSIAKGNLKQTLDIDRGDEVGELAKSFNSMAAQLQASFSNLESLNQALSASESRLKQFLEAIPVGVFVIDTSGKTCYVNSLAQELLGKGIVADTTTTQLPDVYQAYLAGSEQLYPSEHQPVARALRGELVNIDDMEIHQPDRIIPLQVWATPIYDDTGKINYAIAAFADITQRKQSEKILAEYNRTLEAQVTQRTLELSQTLQSLQLTQQELIQSEKMAALGQLVAGIAHEINTPLGAIRASAQNTFVALSESLTQLPHISQRLNSQQQTAFFALIDRSLHSKAQLTTKEKRQHKRNLTQQLQTHSITNAQQIADNFIDMGIYENIEDFFPLIATSDTDWILQLAYNIARLQSNNKNIHTAVERAAKTVFALKSYTRFDNSGTAKLAAITDSIATVLELYHNQLKQGIEVTQNYQPLPSIYCYPDELIQVWTNLIHNAIQAMNNKGKLEINVCQQENHALVQVTDSGCGIPTDIQSRIFEPFFTTKPPGEGSGLGLDIVSKIVAKHQGRIEVVSQPGQTTFSVWLPLQLVCN